jgi:hypothetical protein
MEEIVTGYRWIIPFNKGPRYGRLHMRFNHFMSGSSGLHPGILMAILYEYNSGSPQPEILIQVGEQTDNQALIDHPNPMSD